MQAEYANTVNIPTNIPTFEEPPYRGSFQQLMANNLGKRITAEFMVGTSSTFSVTGVIVGVGVQYLLIRGDNGTTTAGEMFSLKRAIFL